MEDDRGGMISKGPPTGASLARWRGETKAMPAGSPPAPQFLTCPDAPGAAHLLSPRGTRCHRLSPFFHPEADLGLESPVSGRGGDGTDTPPSALPSPAALRPNRGWDTRSPPGVGGLFSTTLPAFNAVSPHPKSHGPP